MAVDTRNKRHSALWPDSPWRGMLPLADSTVAASDRLFVATLYALGDTVAGGKSAASRLGLTGTKSKTKKPTYLHADIRIGTRNLEEIVEKRLDTPIASTEEARTDQVQKILEKDREALAKVSEEISRLEKELKASSVKAEIQAKLLSVEREQAELKEELEILNFYLMLLEDDEIILLVLSV